MLNEDTNKILVAVPRGMKDVMLEEVQAWSIEKPKVVSARPQAFPAPSSKIPTTRICRCLPYQGLHLSIIPMWKNVRTHGTSQKRHVKSHDGTTIPVSLMQQEVLSIGQLHHLGDTGCCRCSGGPPACGDSCARFRHEMDDRGKPLCSYSRFL